jgi:hypothetical protein
MCADFRGNTFELKREFQRRLRAGFGLQPDPGSWCLSLSQTPIIRLESMKRAASGPPFFRNCFENQTFADTVILFCRSAEQASGRL